MIKALVCDIDNTLADGVSWYMITEGLGASVAEHQRIFDDFLSGRISYPESKEQLIGLWQSGGNADKEHFRVLFDNWQLRAGASELFAYAKQRGLTAVIITGSVDLFAETIARKLGVAHWYANTSLVWDEQGNLVDYDYRKEQAAVKLRQLREFAAEHHIPLEACVVLGDGDNDLEMFQAAGSGIALGEAHPELQKAARYHASSLPEAKNLLKQL